MASISSIRLGATVLGLAIVGMSSRSDASGFAIRENSPANVGMAYAGSGSRANDPSTIFANPATMTDIEGNAVEFGVAGVYPTIRYHGNATSGGTPISGTEGNTAGRSAVVPHIYTVFDIADGVKGGLAITVPFGNTVKYKYDFYGRYAPGGIQTAAISMDINPSIAFELSDYVSVGAGVSAQWFQSTFENAINQAALLATPGTPDGSARFKGDNWSFGYNAGVFMKPWHGGRLGLSYRSMVRHKLDGNLTFASIDPSLAALFVNQAASVDVNLPQNANLSLTQEVYPGFDIAGELQWTGWSTFQSSNVNGKSGMFIPLVQGYEDSWMMSIGTSYRIARSWIWRGGLGWDQSPVTDQYRTVGVPDADRYIASMGLSYDLSPGGSFNLAYTHYFAPDANMSASVNGTDLFATTTMNGEYGLGMDFVSAGLAFHY